MNGALNIAARKAEHRTGATILFLVEVIVVILVTFSLRIDFG
jgi:hypothetical protein